jgi:hypothetical protein
MGYGYTASSASLKATLTVKGSLCFASRISFIRVIRGQKTKLTLRISTIRVICGSKIPADY